MRLLKRIAHRAWVDWVYFYGQTRTIDVHVAHPRKLQANGRVSIETVTGVGYKLVAD